MSGPGDIGGEVSGDEAAWRDLIARFDTPGDLTDADAPWPASEDLPAPDDGGDAEPPPVAGAVAPERTRIVWHASSDPRSYSPPEEEDEPYVPTPLPPAAKLDPISKAAWLGLICGPGYLLLGTMLGWTISGPEALVAIAAFVGGFVTLVLKMSDRSPRDDNDDGAVL
jgi:hypothetical protein